MCSSDFKSSLVVRKQKNQSLSALEEDPLPPDNLVPVRSDSGCGRQLSNLILFFSLKVTLVVHSISH